MNIVDLPLTNPDARPRRAITPRGVVLHWVANPGTTARNNRDYFQNGVSAAKQNWASAHYVVDPNEIVRCIPEGEMAYHVGATSYNQAILQKFGTKYPNDCLIGIEICHVDWDGNFDPRTWNLTVELVADILSRYGFSTDCIVRHYDVTGKDCPKLMVRNPAVFEKFKADVANRLRPQVKETAIHELATVVAGSLNVRAGAGTDYPVRYNLQYGEQIWLVTRCDNGWYKTSYGSEGGYVHSDYVRIMEQTPATPPPKPAGPAPDVPADHFAAAAVKWAYENGLSVGVDAQKNFAPDRPMSRAETIVLLKRLADSFKERR